MARRRGSTRGAGWDAIANPVPGDVLSCLDELGLEFNVNDDEAVGKCPMHLARTGKDDRHPSWSVRIEDRHLNNGEIVYAGTHNCFACGYRGSFVKLVADVLEVEWAEAVQWVRARGGIERARKVFADKKTVRADAVDTTKQINEASLALYIDPPEDVLAERSLSLQACLDLGVRFDFEKLCWILPIRDPDTGVLWGWQEKARKYFRNRPTEVTKSKTLFGYNVFEGPQAILVESPLDVARLRSVGYHCGLSSFGVAVSDAQMHLVLDAAESLLVALDNDRDGLKYAAMLQQLYGRRLPMYFLNYDHTDAKDIGEMTDDEIHLAVSTATPSMFTRF